MTKQDKQLLLKDLCARLPYGVMIEIISDGGMVEASYDMRLDAGLLADLLYGEDDFKPYLRPMSSMTEEEKKELKELIDSEDVDEKGVYFLEGGTLEDYLSEFSYKLCNIINDWLNSHHFDYRGLIQMGLALEAPEGMYNFLNNDIMRSWNYYPEDRFSSYEEYVAYLKEKGLAFDVPEEMNKID